MRLNLLLILLPLAAVAVQAQTPTWATEVAPILYDHCVTCHRVGGVGDFPLETWTDWRPDSVRLLTPLLAGRDLKVTFSWPKHAGTGFGAVEDPPWKEGRVAQLL